MKRQHSNFLKGIACMLAVVAAANCGAPHENNDRRGPARLQTLLAEGRRIGAPQAVDGTGLQLAQNGAVSEAQLDKVTGAPIHILYDTSVSTRRFAVAELSQAAEDTAWQLLQPFADSEWSLSKRFDEARLFADGLALVSFAALQNQISVRDATVDVYFVLMPDGAYALREIITRHAVMPQAFRAQLKRSLKNQIPLEGDILERLELSPERYQVESDRQVIFPREQALDTYTYELASEVTIRDQTTGEQLTVTSNDMNGGELLEAYSDRIHAASVAAELYPRSYRDAKVVSPVTFAKLLVGDLSINLDADGRTAEVVEEASSLQLNSSRVRIGAAPGYSMALVAGSTLEKLQPAGNDLNALNAYSAIQTINSFTRRHLQEADARILNRPVVVSINVQGSCNAFYTGTTISLYRAGDNCANMALVNDVIYHEWGHGLDDYTGTNPGITDGAFSEGIGDILAAYLTADANMGYGFFTNSANGIRNLKNTSRFPTNRGEVHEEGKIIGGAFWDLRAALVERYGAVKGAYMAERFFFQHLLTTDSYRNSYAAVVRLDDNDANPATPSPNFCLINTAFTAHGLATATPGCVDSPDGFGYAASADIAAAVLERSTAGTRIMAAAGMAARSMRACFGNAASCSDLDAPEWQALTLDGTLAERIAFVAKDPTLVEPGTLIWLAAYDKDAKLLGRRVVKLISR